MKSPLFFTKKLLSFIQEQLSLDIRENFFYEYFKLIKNTNNDTNNDANKILVQCADDPFYFALFGAIVLSLQKQKTVYADAYIFRRLNVGESKTFSTFVKFRFLVNLLSEIKWKRLYGSFCNGVGYSANVLMPFHDLIDFFKAKDIRSQLFNKKDLVSVSVNGVLIGDLVNDTYLRFKPAPTVNLNDFYLLILLWQSLRNIRRSEKYFSRSRPKVYLTSYSTYIQHGIPVRIALKYGIKVYSFSNHQEFAKSLSLQDFYHTKNPDQYAKDFLKIEGGMDKLNLAEFHLGRRLSGVKDNAISYMKRSPYERNDIQPPDLSGKVVIFLHDFYDSPHIYRDMVFPDFWTWICFTIDALVANKIDFYVKPHPNQIDLSKIVLNDLRIKYKNIKALDMRLTNKQLVDAGLVCGITVYGTVSHELAYLGVPSITCAHNPHISFDFCKNATNEGEYLSLIKNYRHFRIDKKKMREQSLIFYYMHNLNLNEECKALQNFIGNFRSACERPQNDIVDWGRYLEELLQHTAFRAAVINWSKLISRD